jgi:hypothetical protein
LQPAAGSGRKEVEGQRTEDRRQKTEDRFLCGSGFPRPELVEGQPRSCEAKLTAEG